jgi:acetyl esterase
MSDRHFPSTRARASIAVVTSSSQRTAHLTLRGPAGRVRARVAWPSHAGACAPAALVLFPHSGLDAASVDVAELLWSGLCAAAGIIVLLVYWPRSGGYAAAVRDATAATAWVADHGAELDADPRRLFVGGVGRGAAVAADVARDAGDQGWPLITRQLLVLGDPSDAAPQLDGAAPATVVYAGRDPQAVISDLADAVRRS